MICGPTPPIWAPSPPCHPGPRRLPPSVPLSRPPTRPRRGPQLRSPGRLRARLRRRPPGPHCPPAHRGGRKRQRLTGRRPTRLHPRTHWCPPRPPIHQRRPRHHRRPTRGCRPQTPRRRPPARRRRPRAHRCRPPTRGRLLRRRRLHPPRSLPRPKHPGAGLQRRPYPRLHPALHRLARRLPQ
jgi:hypothetical protein